MNKDDMKQLAQDCMKTALEVGADAADAIIVKSQSLSTSVREGKVENVNRSESQDMGLRVIIGQKQAFVSSSSINKDHFQQLAERAIAMAHTAPDDPFCGLATPEQLIENIPDLDILSSQTINAEKLEELALRAETAGLDVAGVHMCDEAGASHALGGMVLAASNGFLGSYDSSRYSIHTTMIAKQGETLERDYDFSSSCHFEDLDTPEQVGQMAAKNVVDRLGARKIESGTFSIVFKPRAASSFLGHLASAISGPSIARGSSFLREKLNQQIFPETVSIIDNPLKDRALASRPFDAEGLATKQLKLIDKGKLTGWLLDCASARELKMSPTGHARRSVSGPPSPGVSNLHLEAGKSSPEDLIASIDNGIYVTDFIGHGVNMTTGDYSRGVAGFRIEKGKITHPVHEITVAGNLLDMFARMIPANDLEFRRTINSPTIMIEDLTIAGI